ncbi:polyprenyl synthetase family protein (plasmid) [Pantoea sp. Nvir]|nr:polyprenyl synthetase family protein [Pantoea sp. Nvir]
MTIFAEREHTTIHNEPLMFFYNIEKRLDQLLPVESERDCVGLAMREGALAPGKRIRPVLLMLVARDLGYHDDHTGLLDFACAIEMVHAASLILDDIPCMDDANVRRGRPTLHRQFGESVAILTAVALLSRAFGVIALAEGLNSHVKTQAVAELSHAIGIQGLVQGQFRDLTEGSQPRSADDIQITNHFKTSTLFGAAMQMASIVASTPLESRKKLQYFAVDLGQAFQLLDDMIDGLSDTGKDAHKDVGKSTLVNILGTKVVEKRLRDHLRFADYHLASACNNGYATRSFVRSWFDKKLAIVD